MPRAVSDVSWLGMVLITAIVTGGCGGGGSASNAVVQPILITVSASSQSPGAGQTSTLSASVVNDSTNAGVTWSMPQGSPGTLTTVDATHATYAAPSPIASSTSVAITATSKADSTKTATVTLQLVGSTSITVSVTPASSDIGATGTVALLASVANDSKNAGVTWSMPQGSPGTLTTVDTTHATYTAPGTVASASSVTITATSITDTSKTGTAAVNLHPIGVAMGTPATAPVGPLQTSKITAASYDPKGVTWSASPGTITDLAPGCPQGQCSAIYTAPADISTNGTAQITATAVTDPTQSASASISLAAASYWEDLVALNNGLNLGVVKPYADLETGGAGSGIFQPDVTIFHEIAPGPNGQPINTEIWRLDNDDPVPSPSANDTPPAWYTPGVLNRTPWNENGTDFILSSDACVPESYHPPSDPAGVGCDLHLFLYDAAGDLQQLVVPQDPARGGNARQLGLSSGYLPWDQFNPNLFYLATYGDTQAAAGETSAGLYSVDLSQNFLMKEIVPLPDLKDPITGYSITKNMQSYLSNDDLVMVQDANPPPVSGTPGPYGCTAQAGCPDYIPNIYMADVNPSSPTYGTIKYQYPIDFPGVTISAPCVPNLNCPGDALPGFSTSDQYHFHDIYFQRDAADHFIFAYGPKGSTGELAFFQASVDGKSVQLAYPDPNLPGVPYMGHPADNYNGTLVSYGGYDTYADEVANTNQGAGVWVHEIDPTLGYDNSLNNGAPVGSLGAESVNHQGWDGYDPNYVIFDGYLIGLPQAYLNQGYPTAASFRDQSCNAAGIANCIAPYGEMSDSPSDPTGASVRVLVDAGLRDSGAVGVGTAPAIVNGPSQSPDATKIIFTLPQDFSNPNGGNNAFIAVDHRPFPPALSASGNVLTWVPYLTHREVAGYHVYRSTDGKTWTEVTASCAGFTAAAFDSLNATTCTDTAAASGTTYEYGVTAQEYSGLESGMLSNVVQVTAGGGAGTTVTAQGTTGFDTTAPAPPTGLTITAMSNPGEWKLTWTASTSPDVRYYDVFYSGGGVPQVSTPMEAQHYLVDSPAANQTSYIYWEANPNDVPVFGMVAIDRQDNYSALACVATANPTAPCP